MDDQLHGLTLRPELLARGYSDDELRGSRRRGALATVRPGAYLPSIELDALGRAARHALLARASIGRLAPGSVLSHASAAVLHGWPVWGVPLGRVHATQPRRAGGRRTRWLHVHTAPLDPGEIVLLGGLAVTSPARTVVDLARTLPFEPAVVIADAALALGAVCAAELDAVLDRHPHRRGNPAARRALAFADGRSESVGESRSRVAVMRAGLPAPVPQWEVRTAVGLLLGRVDFGWPALRTVGEFDGRVKYGRLLRPGQVPGDVVFAEKCREDALRDDGLRVVRWTWGDLGRFAPVAGRLRTAFAAADR